MVKLKDSIELYEIKLDHYHTELMPVYGITNRNISNLYGIEFQNGVCNVLTRVARDHNMKLDMEESTI